MSNIYKSKCISRSRCTSRCSLPSNRYIPKSTPSTPWLTAGNEGTDPSTNYIGASDGTDITLGVQGFDGPHITFTTDGVMQTLLMPGNNILIGNVAGSAKQLSKSSGATNCIIGIDSFGANTVGSGNSALGYGILQSNIDGDNNCAIGGLALNSNLS